MGTFPADTFLILFVVVVAAFTGICISLIFTTRRPGPAIMNFGNNNQTNVNGETQTTSGAYTNIQAYEDTIGHLVQANDILEALNTAISAVQNDNYCGDPMAMLDDLARGAAHHGRYALFIVQQARKGEYAYRTTEGELERAYRNGGSNGNGTQAA